MKTTDIKTLTTSELIDRVTELENQLAELSGDTNNEEGETPPKDAAELWLSIESSLTYERGRGGSYYEVHEQVIGDLALLGRIGHEVTYSHLARNSSSDFAPSNGAGRELDDEQNAELFFFIDRLSSALFNIRDKYLELSRQEEPKKK